MALRMWASSTANALRVSSASKPHLFPDASLLDHLGEVVFVELPEPGGAITQGSGFGAVESVEASGDINSPISGEVVEVNSKLSESPGLINSRPYEGGWMIKVKPKSPSDVESLMGAKEYTKFCEEEDASH